MLTYYVSSLSHLCVVWMRRVNPFGAETGIIRTNLGNNIVADALAPGVARASAATVLTVQDEQHRVSKKETFSCLGCLY